MTDIDTQHSSQQLLSRRHSSDEGTQSEPATSESTHTAMTSVVGTDDSFDSSILEEDSEMTDQATEEDDVHEYQSVYFGNQSHYRFPGGTSTYRTEMHEANGEDGASSTRSLWAQDLDYRELYGRVYCRDWFMPIDDLEQMRCSLNHQVFLNVLNGEHTLVQLDHPTHILDVGTGTGEWAIRMAEQYPACEVIGTDIAAIAETNRVPMNAFFEIEDAEDWDRPFSTYDLIHFRSMEGAFLDWSAVYRNVLNSLKPGGWIELQDFDTTEGLNKFTAQFAPDSPIHSLFSDLNVAAARSGRPRGNAHMHPRVFMEAGFVDVRVTEYMIPFSVAENSAGKIWLISCLDAMEALCLRLLTEHMGWDPEKCKAACEQAAREMASLAKVPEKSNGMLVKICVVVARKPFEPGSEESRHTNCEPSTRTIYYQDPAPGTTFNAPKGAAAAA